MGSEYGLMLFKQLALLNGGALIAIAPLSQFLVGVEKQVFALAAVWFVSGPVLMIAGAYAAHLNLSLVASALEETRNSRLEDIHEILLNDKNPEDLPPFESSHKVRILLTFWASHLFGWLSVGSFCLGAYSLIGATL
ncbi:hypothetical protein [Aquicoccus sp.]|uniref:hypothetical protein n=1 Tax=Aquicoccus sp. TaxID=2055851 RepID=UPI003568C1C9